MTASRFITKDELKRIRQTLVGVRNSQRNLGIVNFLTYTGARVNEVFKVRVSDILIPENRTIKEQFYLKDTKGGVDRLVFIPPRLKNHLLEYLTETNKINYKGSELDNPLFPSERNPKKFIHSVSGCRLVNNILKRAGVETTSHGFRKLYCSNIRAITKDPFICQTAMAHKHPSTTALYWQGDQMEVSKAVSNLNMG